MNPAIWKPTSLDDLIGPSHQIASAYLNRIRSNAENGETPPHKTLFYGPPGTGKSELCKMLATAMTKGTLSFSVERLNGKDLSVEKTRHIASRFGLCSLYSDYQGLWCDEIDKASLDAQKDMLTLLDKMPDGWFFLATTNKDPRNEKEMDSAFVSRFRRHEVSNPEISEVRTLLIDRFGCNPSLASRIATCSWGNVRQALLDLDTELMMAAAA